jgi:hypothetical protein
MVNLVAAALFRWFLTPSWPLHVINLLVTCWVYLLYTLHKVCVMTGSATGYRVQQLALM